MESSRNDFKTVKVKSPLKYLDAKENITGWKINFSSVLVPLDADRLWLLNQIKGYVSLDEAIGE